MRQSRFFFLLGLVFLTPGSSPGQTNASPTPDVLSLAGTKWDSVLAQFEASVSTLSGWLDQARVDLKKKQDEIEALEKKTDALRESTGKNPNIFDEIRLKSLLNDLKGKLDQQSSLQHQWDDKLGDFRQAALSLVGLYNDRIEMELEKADAPDSSSLGSKVDELVLMVQKRNRVESLLRKYQTKSAPDKNESTGDLGSLSGTDRENLQLALDLLQDRKAELQSRIEKSSLEEDALKNELKLQGKMQEFLEDIQRLNEDSDLPKGSLKRNDLEGAAGKGEKARLESLLSETLEKEKLDGQRLEQTGQMMEKVQDQIDSLKARAK